MVSFVLLCAGNSTRMNINNNKTTLPLLNKPLFMYSLDLFKKYSDDVVLVCREIELEYFKEYHNNIVIGGKNRSDSVNNGIKKAKYDVVLVHDGARPLLREEDLIKMLEDDSRLSFLGSYVINTIKDKDTFDNVDRNKLIEAYTPQKVYKEDYLNAYNKMKALGLDFTDDVSLVGKMLDIKPTLIEGARDNKKITQYCDYLELKKQYEKQIRIGHSWDIHRLVENRDLFLGGIKIPFEKGLLGHSDADCLLHAIAESLLGSLALGDLGKFYPDNSDKTLGMDSKVILRECYQRILDLGYEIINLDTMVYCEKPKLKNYILPMRESIAHILGINPEQVSVKATTHEKLGLVGNEEAIASEAVVLICKKEE